MTASDLTDQNEEIEVLQSIFPLEFELISNENEKSFKILLNPTTDDNDNHVSVILICILPPNYPSSEIPIMSIQVQKGLSNDQGSEILAIANTIALENISAPSIFTICEGIKEWLVDNNIEGQDGSMYSEMMRRMNQKDLQQKKVEQKAALKAQADFEYKEVEIDPAEIERIRKRQEGTAVTMETFMIWKKAFDEEMNAKDILLRKSGMISNLMSPLAAVTIGGNTSSSTNNASEILSIDEKPTGKQFFLSQQLSENGVGGNENDLEALLEAAENEEYQEPEIDLNDNIHNKTIDNMEFDEDEDDEDYEPSIGDDDDNEDEDFKG